MTINQISKAKIGTKGQGLTEYLILLILVAVISIAGAKSLGTTVKNKLRLAKDHINKEVSLDN